MNTSQTLKVGKFDRNQKETAASIARSLGQLENDLAATLEHQAYAIIDPDSVIDEQYLDEMLANVDELAAKFTTIGELYGLIDAVRTKTMSAEAMVASRAIDLTVYSSNLSKQK